MSKKTSKSRKAKEPDDILHSFSKYRWFLTNSGKLVVGGKSARQNDELLKKLKREDKDRIVLHTEEPGSPFSIILEDKKKITKSDLEEAAIFTGCFSRAWRSKKAKSVIDIFTLSQLSKPGTMKEGQWLVKGGVVKTSVVHELGLTIQSNKLRAVPLKTLGRKKPLLKIKPGRIDKKEMIPKLQIELNEEFPQDDVLSALPPGGVSIVRK